MSIGMDDSADLRHALTNEEGDGVLDGILNEMKRANDMSAETKLTWIACSLESIAGDQGRIADSLERIADALDRAEQEEAPTSD